MEFREFGAWRVEESYVWKTPSLNSSVMGEWSAASLAVKSQRAWAGGLGHLTRFPLVESCRLPPAPLKSSGPRSRRSEGNERFLSCALIRPTPSARLTYEVLLRKG